MSVRTLLRALLLAAAFALATVLLGWWGVPLAAAAWGALARGAPGSALAAAIGGALGWGALLLTDSVSGPVGPFATTLGGVVGLPGALLVVVTLLFPALLAWSAAAVAGAIARPRARGGAEGRSR